MGCASSGAPPCDPLVTMAVGDDGVEAATGSDRALVPVLVPVLVLFGVAVRVWMLRTPIGGLDADEAIVGLMARHIQDGEFPMFYWGQMHGGPHEPLVTAAFFELLGSNTLVLKLVAVLLSSAACVLIWRVGRRTVGEPAATIGALMFWVWPPAFVWWSVKSRGFYHASLVIGLGILLLVLRLAKRDTGPAKSKEAIHADRDMLLLGALVATGVWCSPQTIFFSAPALVWLAVRRFSVIKLAPWGVFGAIFGALPWWVYQLEHDWSALRSSGASIAMPRYGDHLRGFFETGLPGALGFKIADGSAWVGGGLGKALYVASLFAFVASLMWELLPRRRDRRLRAARSLLLLMVLAYPLLFALSPYTWFVAHPRYLYYLTAVLALLLARGLVALRWQGIALGLIAVMTLSTAAFAVMHRDDVFFSSAEGVLIPEDLGPALDYMTARGIEHVYADYWLAYVVAFESDERITATPYRGAIRNGAADAAVRSVADPAYLFLEGSVSEPIFQNEVTVLGIPHERLSAHGFVIYTLSQNAPPEAFPAMRGAPLPPKVR